MGWNLRKMYPNTPYFYDFCHWNRPTPYFFALHARGWGKCCFVKHSRNLENVVFLKQNLEIWWILLGTNLIKVWKQNFSSTGSTDQLCIMDEIHWRAGTGHHAPPPTGQTQKRICILQSPSVWFCTSWLSKQMPSIPEAVRAVAS